MISLNSMKRLKEENRKVDSRNLVTSTLVSKNFRESKVGKMSMTSNIQVGTAKNGGKCIKVLGTGRKFKLYLDRLDQVFEVEPIVTKSCNEFGIRIL